MVNYEQVGSKHWAFTGLGLVLTYSTSCTKITSYRCIQQQRLVVASKYAFFCTSDRQHHTHPTETRSNFHPVHCAADANQCWPPSPQSLPRFSSSRHQSYAKHRTMVGVESALLYL